MLGELGGRLGRASRSVPRRPMLTTQTRSVFSNASWSLLRVAAASSPAAGEGGHTVSAR